MPFVAFCALSRVLRWNQRARQWEPLTPSLLAPNPEVTSAFETGLPSANETPFSPPAQRVLAWNSLFSSSALLLLPVGCWKRPGGGASAGSRVFPLVAPRSISQVTIGVDVIKLPALHKNASFVPEPSNTFLVFI